MPQNGQYIATSEWFIPRLNSLSQFFAFALLASTAFITVTSEAVAAKKAKNKYPVWEKEIPPSVARSTAIATATIIAPIGIDSFKPLPKVLAMLKSRAIVRPETPEESLQRFLFLTSKCTIDPMFYDRGDDAMEKRYTEAVQNSVLLVESSLSANNL